MANPNLSASSSEQATEESSFTRAQRVLPGGVNSPVRAFRATGGEPVFVSRAEGAYLVGEDDTRYIDYVASWGPMVLGHAHPDVVRAVSDAAAKGTSYGAPTRGEIEIAELIAQLVPQMEMSRLVSSGTEATMAAIRLARGVTGRALIIKCAGGYHGGVDSLLVRAGSGAATFGSPDSAGVPAAIAATTVLVPYNDLPAVEAVMRERGDQIAAVIIEPVAGNMGCVPPVAGWLEGLRSLCTTHGALLIFDEVMTGFRVALGGAQARFGVTPDLTCLGKIVGGGLPVGAYGGPRELMEHVAPLGPVYQAGTLSGNPLAVAAGLTTLKHLQKSGVYDQLEAIGAEVERQLTDAAAQHGVPIEVQRVGAMLTAFFRTGPVRNFEDAEASDLKRFGAWHQALIRAGVHWPPSQFEAAFPGLAHAPKVLEASEAAFLQAFEAVAS